MFRVLDYGFKRVGMSRGEKIQSIDACLYFCHNSLSLPYHLIFLFSFEFFSLLSLGVFYLPLVTPSSFRSSPVHGYLYPFYTFLNLRDFSLLSLRLYQLLLASFQDYPLVCWLPDHYLCSEGTCHTTPHFQTKILVLFLSRSLPCLPSADKGLSVLYTYPYGMHQVLLACIYLF